MRKVQVSIQVERFGDQAPNGKRDALVVYADANNPYEAVCAALYETLDIIKKHSGLPGFGRRGRRESIDNKEFWGLGHFTLKINPMLKDLMNEQNEGTEENNT